jgi:hypothetical protein
MIERQQMTAHIASDQRIDGGNDAPPNISIRFRTIMIASEFEYRHRRVIIVLVYALKETDSFILRSTAEAVIAPATAKKPAVVADATASTPVLAAAITANMALKLANAVSFW